MRRECDAGVVREVERLCECMSLRLNKGGSLVATTCANCDQVHGLLGVVVAGAGDGLLALRDNLDGGLLLGLGDAESRVVLPVTLLQVVRLVGHRTGGIIFGQRDDASSLAVVRPLGAPVSDGLQRNGAIRCGRLLASVLGFACEADLRFISTD